MTSASRSLDRKMGFVAGDSTSERSSTGIEVKPDTVHSILRVSVSVAVMVAILWLAGWYQVKSTTMASVCCIIPKSQEIQAGKIRGILFLSTRLENLSEVSCAMLGSSRRGSRWRDGFLSNNKGREWRLAARCSTRHLLSRC